MANFHQAVKRQLLVGAGAAITDWATGPTGKVMLVTPRWDGETETAGLDQGMNPGSRASTEYVPGARPATIYLPVAVGLGLVHFRALFLAIVGRMDGR